MYASESVAEQLVQKAVEIAGKRDHALLAALDDLPAPIYVIDAAGFITYFNRACIDFSGRMPTIGQDRWCVTWKLYTDRGEFLPHDQCPMAVAIYGRRPVRGVIAVAERPDGTRVTFEPYPAPLFDADGTLLGGVNILIDVTDSRQAAFLESQASRCRRLAAAVGDRQTAGTLCLLAREYERKAAELTRAPPARACGAAARR